jgi:hypothetical protein
MKTDSRTYSHSDKIKVLRILEKNNFNYLQTEKATGVTRKTIKGWEASYGCEVFLGKTPTLQALEEIDNDMKNNEVNLIKKYYIVREMLLHKIMQIIPLETRLDSLVSALKCISDIIINIENSKPVEQSNTSSIIGFINEQLKLYKQAEIDAHHELSTGPIPK